MATSTGIRQTINRVRRAWADIDYAQQRLFEIRTGVPVTRRSGTAGSATELDTFDALERHAARP